MPSSREWRLVARPQGQVRDDDVALVTVELGDPGPGEVLVRNHLFSLDPGMRGRMDDYPSYAPPYTLGEAMTGDAVGEVVASGDPTVPEGTPVRHNAGWREYAILPASEVRPVDGSIPLHHWIGALGNTGFTAWYGITRVGLLQPGETCYVNAAAGATGSVAGQVAKALGARVIGSAGTPEKVAYLTGELGFDDAFGYRDRTVRAALKELVPGGLDVCFDNVGGPQLEDVIFRMRPFGRIVLCGGVSQYDSDGAAGGPRNLIFAVTRRLTLRGFVVLDHEEARSEFEQVMITWVREGIVAQRADITEGIETAFDTLRGVLRGANFGKTLIRVSD